MKPFEKKENPCAPEDPEGPPGAKECYFRKRYLPAF
nr:MAG TPA: hypothetical protein [Caudoviricetes sp.]